MRDARIDYIAQTNGFTKHLVKGGEFWLTTYQKVSDKSLPYVFYIESDGAPFTAYGVSDNPTPINPLMLELAALDDRPNVVYIARPCQYTPMNLNPSCDKIYWTYKRMSEEVITSVNNTINIINSNHLPFSIIGYSGGGGIAVLIAARNEHVQDIITLAGNLDHISFVKYHQQRPRKQGISPMVGSLNPIDYTAEVSHIPQLHISGSQDETVPIFIADKFVHKSNSICVHQEIFNNKTHSQGWKGIWKTILALPLECY